MKKSEFQKRINDAVDYNKVDKGYAPASKDASSFFSGFKKKVLPFVMALGIAAGGLSLAACNDEKKPVEPVDPNPPIVTPIDPENPDPDKPGPVDPVDPNPPVVDPGDPENPDTPPDKTPEEIEKEKQEKIVQNIYAAVKPKFSLVHGRNFTVNNVFAVDYISNESDNSIYMVMDTSIPEGRTFDLIRFPVETKLTEENLLNGVINTTSGTKKLLTVDARILENSNNEMSSSIYKKFIEDKTLQSTSTPNFMGYNYGGGATDSELGGYTRLQFYTITESEIEKTDYAVSSDISNNGFITDNLINGTLGKTYKQFKDNTFYHQFSENLIMNLHGLNYEKQAETETATKNIMLNGRKIGVYKNNQVYINLDEEQEI